MSHIKLLDLRLDKENYTRHGMHLNSKGKEKVARIIGQYINEQLNRQDNNIITLPWTKDNKYPISLMESEVPAAVWLTEVMDLRHTHKMSAMQRCWQQLHQFSADRTELSTAAYSPTSQNGRWIQYYWLHGIHHMRQKRIFTYRRFPQASPPLPGIL
ncbi:uncharacterized protein LOC111873944 isoform X1 [Cryptotermes secundus]|uniref:uncharacterized protein LOC111873944 isoform X1 n=1 Tax=Cryptotermes secundus TaxID=105785 RepID=UPI001454CFEF|nr:uncharacterized protein LOC111873944 isoform X1 [Cryptotermes secundus]